MLQAHLQPQRETVPKLAQSTTTATVQTHNYIPSIGVEILTLHKLIEVVDRVTNSALVYNQLRTIGDIVERWKDFCKVILTSSQPTSFHQPNLEM